MLKQKGIQGIDIDQQYTGVGYSGGRIGIVEIARSKHKAQFLKAIFYGNHGIYSEFALAFAYIYGNSFFAGNQKQPDKNTKSSVQKSIVYHIGYQKVKL
jgi:hypothetical protein